MIDWLIVSCKNTGLYFFSIKVNEVKDCCKTDRIFAYSSTREQSDKRSGTRLKTESETGERRAKNTLIFFSCLTRRKTLYTLRFTDFFTDFEKKKTRLFCSLMKWCIVKSATNVRVKTQIFPLIRPFLLTLLTLSWRICLPWVHICFSKNFGCVSALCLIQDQSTFSVEKWTNKVC